MQQAEGLHDEEYARSLSTLRSLGSVAARGNLAEASTDAYELAYQDFRTGVEEMLKTDPDFRESLDVDSTHHFAVIEGKAVSATGTPIVSVIENGMRAAFKAAQTDPRMWAQYARDMGDRQNAEKVDALLPGQSLVALSMDPKRELEQDRKFWEGKGYRQGIAYIQWYSKPSADKVVAGSFSVDMSDEQTWRELFAKHGRPVPAGVTPNEWLAQSIELDATPEQTKQYVKDLRDEYYQLRGAARQRFSVTEYVQQHEILLRQQFGMYYPALGQAIMSGKTNSVMAGFAQSLLLTARKLDPAKREQLSQLVGSGQFDAAAGRLVDGALSYAVVEDLRRGLHPLIHGTASEPVQYVFDPGLPPDIQYQLMNERMATNVQSGATAGRRYGGCPGEFNPLAASEQSSSSSKDGTDNPQDAYGGRGGSADSSETSSSSDVCVYEHQGCYCCAYNDDGTPSSTTLTVKALSKNGKATCLRVGCGAWITDNDKDEGRIWRRAQRLLEAESQQTQPSGINYSDSSIDKA